MHDVVSYPVNLYRNQNSIVSYSNADVDVSYPVAIDRNLYAVVSYSAQPDIVTWMILYRTR